MLPGNNPRNLNRVILMTSSSNPCLGIFLNSANTCLQHWYFRLAKLATYFLQVYCAVKRWEKMLGPINLLSNISHETFNENLCSEWENFLMPKGDYSSNWIYHHEWIELRPWRDTCLMFQHSLWSNYPASKLCTGCEMDTDAFLFQLSPITGVR